MTEKDMQRAFKKYLTDNPPSVSEAYELKICKGTSLPFDAVQPHQVDALLKVKDSSFYHKIQDMPVSWGQDTKIRFTKKKPFDCLVLVQAPAYVVIWFYHEREKKVFVKIPINTFLQEKLEADRKSLTEERAYEIGERLYL